MGLGRHGTARNHWGLISFQARLVPVFHVLIELEPDLTHLNPSGTVNDPHQDHLSQIQTLWSVVRDAAAVDHPDRQSAQKRILEIYGPSIHRYLLACMRDPHAVDEVYQEFALKLARGDFAGVDPARGRFRGFVKTILYRLIVDFHRRKGRNTAASIDVAEIDPAGQDETTVLATEEEFHRIWRDGLLHHAWQSLKQDQEERGHLYHALLKARVDQPDWTVEQVIESVRQETGKEQSAGSFRVTLHRARKRFADFLVEAVASSVPHAANDLEEELIALDLLRYCRDALQRRS